MVGRHYDAAGRMDSTTDWLGNTTAFHTDANANLDLTTFPTGPRTDVFAFDRANNLTSVSFKQSGTATATATYGRLAGGESSSATTTGLPGGSESYGYDTLNRLTGVNSSTYEYDNADNLTKRLDDSHQAYNTANQLTLVNPPGWGSTMTYLSTTYQYNNRGNRTGMGSAPSRSRPPTPTTAPTDTASANAAPGQGVTGQYHATSPTRVLNSVAATANTPLAVQLSGTTTGIPTTGVSAVALNLSVTGATRQDRWSSTAPTKPNPPPKTSSRNPTGRPPTS